jgi:hypothetical protein
MDIEQSQMQSAVDSLLVTNIELSNLNKKRKASQEPEEAQEEEGVVKALIQPQEEGKENNKNTIESLDPDEKKKDPKLFHRSYGKYTDFVIKYKKEAYHVHRFILERESKYFVNWFEMHKEEKEITIEPIGSSLFPLGVSIESRVMHKFIRLMYSITDEEAFDIMNFGYGYGADGIQGPLIAMCSYFWAEKCKTRIVSGIKKYSEKTGNRNNWAFELLKWIEVYSADSTDTIITYMEQLLISHIIKDKELSTKLSGDRMFRRGWLKLKLCQREKILLGAMGAGWYWVENSCITTIDSSSDSDESSVLSE